MPEQTSSGESGIPKNTLEERLKVASHQGVSGLWFLVPIFVLALGSATLVFGWQYLTPLMQTGGISTAAGYGILAGCLLATLILLSAIRTLLSFYFTNRTLARSLRFENEMLRLIVEGVNDGTWDWDVIKKEIYFSPRWLEMFGYRRGGLTNDPAAWLALSHPEDLPAVQQALELHFEGRTPFFHVEHRIRTLAGEYKWVLDRGRAVFDDKKQPIRISGSTTDMMRLKEVENVLKGQAEQLERANEEIKHEKVKYQALLASIGEGMIATDKEGKVIVMNERAGSLLGRTVSECMGKRFSDVVAVEENDKEEIVPMEERPFMKTLAGGVKVSTTMWYVRKDGTKFPASVTSAPIVLEGETLGVIVVFRDITHEKEIDKAKTEFVSLASHQLRTPLSAIRWYSEMLISEKLGPLNENQRTYLKEVYDSNRRMIDLVNALLNVSRIDLGTFAVEPVDTDIVAISESVLMELRVKTEAKTQTVNRDYEKDFPKVKVDPKLMRIILQNLLSNAVKYTPEHGTISAAIHRSEDGKNMVIKVSDSGVGIPKNVQDKIFQKLFRADNARQVESEGTGLGLYIIKAIVEKSAGRTWFESEENKGTTFFVEMPLTGMIAVHGAKDLS